MLKAFRLEEKFDETNLINHWEKVMGAPALPVKEFMRREAWLRKAVFGKRET